MKVCIIGSFGFRDIGDEAMLTEDLHYLKSVLGVRAEDIWLFGSDTGYLAQYHEHPEANCVSDEGLLHNSRLRIGRGVKRWRLLLGRLARGLSPVDLRARLLARECDFLLVTGGGTINSRDAKGGSLQRMHALVTYFAHLGKPVFMSGQTIGPLGLYRRHDKLAQEIVETVDFLSVRDSHYSRRYLTVVGAWREQLLETYDDAYSLPWEGTEIPDETSRFLARGPTVAMNVTDYTADTAEKRHFFCDLVEWVVKTKQHNVVLVSHTPTDLSHLYMVWDALEETIKASVHLPDLRMARDRTLKAIIARCAAAIGGRYHFIVFAGSAGVPFVGLCGNHYSYIKQDGFARPLGYSHFILNERDTWSREKVHAAVEDRLRSARLKPQFDFSRPTASMRALGEWVARRFGKGAA